MKFPEWAPTALVGRYKAFLGDEKVLAEVMEQVPHLAIFRKTLIRLTTNPKMERVWNQLYKRRVRYEWEEHRPPGFGDGIFAEHLHDKIVEAIHDTERKVTTRSEDVLRYQEIATDARMLAAKVRQSRLDVSPFRWFPGEEINTILVSDILPEKAAGCFCLIHDESEFRKKGSIYQEFIYTDLSGNYICKHLLIAENTRDFFNTFCISTRKPSISEILKSMADEADTEAKHEKEKKRIANNSSITKATIFVRALCPFWFETFGGPLELTFAALCRAVLDDELIGNSTINTELRNYKDSKKGG